MSDAIFICPKCAEQFPIPADEAEWAKPCPKCGVSVLPPPPEPEPAPEPEVTQPEPASAPAPTGPRKSAALKITAFNLHPTQPAAAPLKPSAKPSATTPVKKAPWEVLGYIVAIILIGVGAWWWLNRDKTPPATETAAATTPVAPTPVLPVPAPVNTNVAGTKPEQIPAPPTTESAPTNTAGTTPEQIPTPVPTPPPPTEAAGTSRVPRDAVLGNPEQPAAATVSSGGRPMMLLNPGFELGLDGWVIRTHIDNNSVVAIAEAAHTGNLGVRLTDSSTNSPCDVMSRRFIVEPGAKYEARCWARIVSGSGAGLYLRFFGPNKTGRREVPRLVPWNAKDWYEVIVTATPPEGATNAEVWFHTMGAAVVTVDVDDFSLRKLE